MWSTAADWPAPTTNVLAAASSAATSDSGTGLSCTPCLAARIRFFAREGEEGEPNLRLPRRRRPLLLV